MNSDQNTPPVGSRQQWSRDEWTRAHLSGHPIAWEGPMPRVAGCVLRHIPRWTPRYSQVDSKTSAYPRR